MKCAAHQPAFIPWLGFFEKASKVDVFVLLDNVKFTNRDFINRNKIRTPDGWMWLTVPVSKGSWKKIIAEVKIVENKWRSKMVKSIQRNYGRAKFFESYFEIIKRLLSWKNGYLLQVNLSFLKWLFDEMKVSCDVVLQSCLELSDLKASEMLVEITKQVGCDTYLSGQGALNYLKPRIFEEEGIKVEWQNFIHPIYPQVFTPFIENMSILDGLLNMGEKVKVMIG